MAVQKQWWLRNRTRIVIVSQVGIKPCPEVHKSSGRIICSWSTPYVGKEVYKIRVELIGWHLVHCPAYTSRLRPKPSFKCGNCYDDTTDGCRWFAFSFNASPSSLVFDPRSPSAIGHLPLCLIRPPSTVQSSWEKNQTQVLTHRRIWEANAGINLKLSYQQKLCINMCLMLWSRNFLLVGRKKDVYIDAQCSNWFE